ncbi:hypothetical protein [Salinarimonas chemoclinalis]|uniref:hypothetical protein n=1 Tax=Salinarimonas chemoclinalis TaxID=3241599 RepID=UPI003556AE40
MSSFFLLMLIASGFGLAKLVVLAKVLEPAAFGEFVTLLGAGALSGILLSFGTVEATVKTYPRLWTLGRAQEIRASARAAATTLALRFAVVGGLAAAAAAFGLLPYGAPVVLATAAIGLLSAVLSLLTSILRAADATDSVRNLMLARNGLAFALALAGAFAFSWQGALFGEAIGAAVAVAIGRRDARRRARPERAVVRTIAGAEPPVTASRGLRLYVAYLSSAAISMGDRAAVNAAAGAAAAGAYGIVVIVVQAGQILVNILIQRIGAILIKGAADDGSRPPPTRLLLAAAFGCAALASGGLLALHALGWPAAIWDRYDISRTTLVLAGLVAGLQIYSVLEYHLIARDAETSVLLASVAALAVAVLGVVGAAVLAAPLEGYVTAVLAARVVQIMMLALSLRARRDRAPAPDGGRDGDSAGA